MKTYKDLKIDDIKKVEYNYQEKLTDFLDNYDDAFSQELIDKIILWKINRYAFVPKKTLDKINKIKKSDEKIDIPLTREILSDLLDENLKGIKLAIASTILRFKNPNIYQIIDQRVYRFIYGENFNAPKSIDEQINLYLKYLEKLKNVSKILNIDYQQSDRILYELDKTYNKGIKIKY